MKILHVLTFVGPGNPFGGPVSVARGHAAELRARGHEVDVIAAQPRSRRRGSWSSESMMIRGFDAYPIAKGWGFSGLVSPRMLAHVVRRLRGYDVVHVHLARDLVTLPVAVLALLLRVPYVIQAHGMVDPSSKSSARLLDRLATRRVLRGATAVLTLTPQEDDDITAVAAPLPHGVTRLVNGVVPMAAARPPASDPVRFLFCARLHRRKRPDLFVEAARRLIGEGSTAEFRLVGADEGDASVVQAAMRELGDHIRWVGPIEPAEVGAELDAATVLVLPSGNEPFPMVVLEALARSRPVIVTDECGLAPAVAEGDGGLVIPVGDVDALAAAMRSIESSDPAAVEAMGRRGRELVERSLSLGAVVQRLEGIYRRSVMAVAS